MKNKAILKEFSNSTAEVLKKKYSKKELLEIFSTFGSKKKVNNYNKTQLIKEIYKELEKEAMQASIDNITPIDLNQDSIEAYPEDRVGDISHPKDIIKKEKQPDVEVIEEGYLAFYRKMSKNGAVTIPSDIRKSLGLRWKDKFEVEIVDEDTIQLKRISGTCYISGEAAEDLFLINGKAISKETLEKALDLINLKENEENIVSELEPSTYEKTKPGAQGAVHRINRKTRRGSKK